MRASSAGFPVRSRSSAMTRFRISVSACTAARTACSRTAIGSPCSSGSSAQAELTRGRNRRLGRKVGGILDFHVVALLQRLHPIIEFLALHVFEDLGLDLIESLNFELLEPDQIIAVLLTDGRADLAGFQRENSILDVLGIGTGALERRKVAVLGCGLFVIRVLSGQL